MDYHVTRDDEYLTTCPENLSFRQLHYCSEKKFEEWVDDVSQVTQLLDWIEALEQRVRR